LHAILIGVLASLAIASLSVGILAPSRPPFVSQPPPPPPVPANYTQGPQPQSPLSSEQLSKALGILQSDPSLSGALSRAGWRVLMAGPSALEGGGTGVVMLLRFSEPVALSGEYTLMNGERARVQLWTQSVMVKVDLDAGRLVAVDPLLAKPPADVAEFEWVKRAKERCGAYVASAGAKPGKVLLAGVYVTEKYPQGLAVFYVESTAGEYFVSYDVARAAVLGEATGPVIKG